MGALCTCGCQIGTRRVSGPHGLRPFAWYFPCSGRGVPIHIDDPCPLTPDALHGPPERQYCARCDRQVHNLSMMSEAEAYALIYSYRPHRLCVRVDHAADGAPRFRDMVPAASLTRRLVPVGLTVAILATVAAGVSTVLYSSLGGIGSRPHERPSEPQRDAEPRLVDQTSESPGSTSP